MRHQRTDFLAVGTERGNKCGQRNHAGFQEQLGHFSDTADIFDAVFS